MIYESLIYHYAQFPGRLAARPDCSFPPSHFGKHPLDDCARLKAWAEA